MQSWRTLAKTWTVSTAWYCQHSFDFQNTQTCKCRTRQGVSDRNGIVVLILMVMELTLFWNHVGVILVDCSVPHNTPIYSEILPAVEGELLMLRQQRLLVGRKWTRGGAPGRWFYAAERALPWEPEGLDSSLLRDRLARETCITASLWVFAFASFNEVWLAAF